MEKLPCGRQKVSMYRIIISNSQAAPSPDMVGGSGSLYNTLDRVGGLGVKHSGVLACAGPWQGESPCWPARGGREHVAQGPHLRHTIAAFYPVTPISEVSSLLPTTGHCPGGQQGPSPVSAHFETE